MEHEHQQLRGMVETVTFQNTDNGFAVLSLQAEDGDLVCVVGPLAGCSPGEELLLTGRFVEHTTYGVQFQAESVSFHLPEGEAAILKYLSSGVINGIGPVTARRIVQRFGDKTLEVIANDPERLCEVRGVTPAKAREAGRQFLEVFGAREAVASFSRLGLTSTESLALYRQLGKEAADDIVRNPYLLCGTPLFLPFARVDEIADRLAIGRDTAERTRAAILYTLRHNANNGHTCLPKERLLTTASSFFGIEPKAIANALDELCAMDETSVVTYDEVDFVYMPDMLHAELFASLRIKELAAIPTHPAKQLDKQIEGLEIAGGLRYAPQQREAIRQALSRHILIITGGPGTGKTTTINAIISLYEAQADRVLLAAPTGRAAKRLGELTGRKATTIHRLLEVEYDRASNSPRFSRNEKNPLRCDVLVVDEMSMVDASLFSSMLLALRPGARLVLVGDADQLPSVGPGNVLKGLLESGVVPCVQLTEIFRQAAESLIVTNAHRIVEGAVPQKGGKEADFFFLKSYGTACQRLLCELVASRLPNGYGLNPSADIQVLCPGRKGILGTEQLNTRLQEMLNPAGPEKPEARAGGRIFRLGDKVMQVKNNYDIPFTRTDGEPGAGAFNGDIGFIEEIVPSTGAVTVLCEDRHVYYSPEFLHELEPAWAVTIHKSQGSEFEAIVIPVCEVPKRLQYRNLLYTGVTRAKRLCVLVGEEEIVAAMVRNGRRNQRFSCFANFLRDEDLV